MSVRVVNMGGAGETGRCRRLEYEIAVMDSIHVGVHQDIVQ